MTASGLQPIVLRALAKWPDVPDAYGWLLLDRRGEWRLKNPASGAFERIGNAALRGFIARNYAVDAAGRWYFQNGPQRVFVKLQYTPFVARVERSALIDQCGRRFDAGAQWLDDEGSLLVASPRGVALMHDRDLARYAETAGSRLERLERVDRGAVPARFGFDPDPAPRP
ncbi:MAG: hypothetical protein A3I65_03445 [Betaproteobacteria bacterium RIFCSPLOWO2_02_FULL_68_150]|nr:MAG: hypothetical protein A3I65_03445 [Betaproteobacteria bacterium RIFCSPLOWO2_02_FULL_68_150]